MNSTLRAILIRTPIVPFHFTFLTAFVVAVILVLFSPGSLIGASGFTPTKADWESADARLQSLTLEEKVGQLIQVGWNARYQNQDSAEFQELVRQVEENKIGSLLFFAGPVYETVHLANRMQEIAEIPLLIALDAETGVGMRFDDVPVFPWNMAIAATGKTAYARRAGEITGRDARTLGIQQVYAPVLDVNNNAQNPVINVRSYGENPRDVARFGTAFIEGVQSQRVIATAKHFPGHGDTHVDSHIGLPVIDVSPERLNRLELVPFKEAITAGVGSVMIAHISLPQVDPEGLKPINSRMDEKDGAHGQRATRPATLSPEIQTSLLRENLNFSGLTVTDAMSMSGLTQYVDQKEAGVMAVKAGADILVKPADADAMIDGILKAVLEDRIQEEQVDQSVRRILAWKHAVGLFDKKITPIDGIDSVVGDQKTKALVDEIASDAITLVCDKQQYLPLSKESEVFVLGLSNGSGGEQDVRPLMNFLKENDIPFDSAVLESDSDREDMGDIRQKAAHADVIIAGLFGRIRSGARNSGGLPKHGVALLREFVAENKRVVGISFGNPYVLQEFPKLGTYIVAYGSLPELQRAAMRGVFGMQTFKGRLPISLPGLYPRGTGASRFRPEKTAEIDDTIQDAIADKQIPGGVLWFEYREEVYKKAYGQRTVVPEGEPMTLETRFDVASLTKVVATTPAIMLLVERGNVELDELVKTYIPEFAGGKRNKVTVRHLLTHTSGLRPGIGVSGEWAGWEEAIRKACEEQPQSDPGTTYRYSDINFILLGEIVQRQSGSSLDAFTRSEIYEPLGMMDTGFLPSNESHADIAPTEVVDGSPFRGVVHDPTARKMGGVAGHAGIFSTASDLAHYARMLLNKGSLGEVRIFKAETVELMTEVQTSSSLEIKRGLGWDIDSPYSSPRGALFPVGSYGHTGWTGTSLWIDPYSDSFLIFLANRNHPTEEGSVVALRSKLGTLAAEAIADFEFPGKAEVTKNDFELKDRENVYSSQNTIVLNGIGRLKEEDFAPLEGLRVGLITNHTGHNRERNPTIDLLWEASQVDLKALFSPEHGIRGAHDDKISDSVDEKTGLPIHSLYGETRKPTPEQLDELDVLVFDIQDIGCRFYTYISTMGLAMEACSEKGIPLIVLDRVNPINGESIEGPLLTGERSFVGFHDIPLRHGMTVGELARMFNAERGLNAELKVIALKNWEREQWFDETGLPWTNPSPNMRNLKQAILYPGIGLLERAVSVGRGTDTPFEVVGAPYIDDVQLAEELNDAELRGVRFVPIRFTPDASVHQGESCGGVYILLTDREACNVVDVGIQIALTLYRLYPGSFDPEQMQFLLLNSETLDAIKALKPLSVIKKNWQTDLQEFRERRSAFLLY